MSVPTRTVAYSVCVFTLIFLMFWPLQAQDPAPASLAENAAMQGSAASVPSPLNNMATGKVTIFYTSQLFGYFRAPDVQSGVSEETGCKAAESSESPAAKAFDVLWAKEAKPGDILVGTGNSLAPVLWVRQFDPAPNNQYRGLDPQPGAAFKRSSKELFAWDPNRKPPQWVTIEQVAADEEEQKEIKEQTGKLPDPDSLPQRLRRGEGTIPTDNAACFLRRAGYAAIVPGKYDFYYGPERLRELARFLASGEEVLTGPDDKEKMRFEPVQMLGANLVIETTWKSDHKPLGDREDPPNFAPWTEESEQAPPKDSTKNPDSEQTQEVTVPTVASPKDGSQVYPWFPGAELALMDFPETSDLLDQLREERPKIKTRSDLENFLKREEGENKDTDEAKNKDRGKNADQRELQNLDRIVANFPVQAVYLCKSSEAGRPNSIVPPGEKECAKPLPEPEVRVKGTSVEFFYPFPLISKFSTLLPGANYGLCLKSAKLKIVPAKANQNFYCARFSAYTPFFQFPAESKTKCKDSNGNQVPCYNDPGPYKFVESPGHPEEDVAIFGVVDPNLGQDVGMLNFAWSNSDTKKYKTETAVKDPGEALNEVVGFFEHKYAKKTGREFTGVKVLLAQMTPEEAQKLASRVGGFDSVISDADTQLSGVGEVRTAEWKKQDRNDPKAHHAFLAVPQPYWVSDRKPRERVDLGKLTIDIGTGKTEKTFRAVHKVEEQPPEPQSVSAPSGFWVAVAEYAKNQCRTEIKVKSPPLSDTSSESEKRTALQSIAGCALQQDIGADVVLLQKRDFYLDWQQRPDPRVTLRTFQQFLDRVIWKGDFLTLMYVPGSTLQSVMKQSKAFDDDDKSLLSLSGETDRGLVAFGIRLDSNSGGYLINEAPLDPTRVYAVATTDFIAAGDTGYPDMAANAIRQFSTPEDFDSLLKNISGLVCQRLPPPPATKQSGPSKATSLLPLVTAPSPPPLDSGGKPAGTCMDAINRDSYFDELAISPTDTRPGDTWSRQLWEWSIFDPSKHVPGSTGEKGTSEKPAGLEAYVEQRRLGSTRINQPATTLFAIDDAALSLNMLNHKFSDAELAQTFLGNPTPQLSARRSHMAGYDIQPKFLYSWHKYQIFENTEMSYNVQYTGNLNAPRTVNQKANLFSSDTGLARDLQDRTLPHVEILGTFHYETQLWAPTPVTLAPLPKGDTFLPGVNTARTHYFLPRLGVRYVNRTSWIEAGLEDGGELHAVRLVPPAAGGTQFGLSRTNVLVSGTYWKWHLVVPFGQKVSWTEDEDGDFFFKQTGDAPTDTRFRSDTKTAVNFTVFPSLAFAPTYEFFYYSNKVQGDWFWQNQASIQMKVRFDFWNRNRPVDQFKYKAPSGTSQ